MLEVLKACFCILLCMLEVVEDEVCSMDVLDVPAEMIGCKLLCMLEVMEDWLSLLHIREDMERGFCFQGAEGDVLYTTLYFRELWSGGSICWMLNMYEA